MAHFKQEGGVRASADESDTGAASRPPHQLESGLLAQVSLGDQVGWHIMIDLRAYGATQM